MAVAMYSGPRIRTNLPALNAYNALSSAGLKIAEGQLRLSTGKRINNASDDVAGFITSRALSARNGSLAAAKRAAGEAKNVTGIAMDSLEQIGDLVTQIKDMAAQSAAGALGTDEKVTLANSAYRLAQQIQFIADSTVFGGKQLLQGGFSGNWVTGYSATNQLMTIGINLAFATQTVVKDGSAKSENDAVNLYNLTGGFDGSSSGDPTTTVDPVKFNLNATRNQLATNGKPGELKEFPGGYLDGDTSGVKQGSGGDGFGGIAGLNLSALGEITGDTLAGSIWDTDKIQATLMSLDFALTNINKVGTYLGGIHTRLTFQEDTLTSQITNYKAAISRIEDADVAEEQMKLITQQFLQSASLTSLAQANQNPTEFLQLLR
jgi:flagellin